MASTVGSIVERCTMTQDEREFWRAIYALAFDNGQGPLRTYAHFADTCARHADAALEEYRKRVSLAAS